jgi:hypothetical protein
MRKKLAFLVLALGIFSAVPAYPTMTCEEGHGFVWQGRWYCNPGAGADGCLRCWDEIEVP